MDSRKSKVSFKSVLVTGGTGFIGSNLVKECIQVSEKVVVPYIELDKRSIFSQENLQQQVILEQVDISDKNKIFNLITINKIEYIIHLAAQTLVTEAYKNPLETFTTNIIGTANLLEAARLFPHIKGIIIASSDKAYGKTTSIYTEESPLKGDHPYDVSKSSADLISQTYFKTYNVPVVITRFGNVYGEGDLHFGRIIPGILEALIKKKELQIRSNGTYVRDYLYVKDVVRGYMFLLNNLQEFKGNAYNFSSKDTLSVLELIKKVEEILQVKIPYKILNTAKNEIPYQHLDDTKIRNLGWESQYTLENCLENTLVWYKRIII